MKRILILTLLLSLGLAGCALTLPEEMPLEPPILPTPAVPGTREFVADSSMETFSAEDDPVEPDESDVVTVHQESIPTRVENEARWDGFLAAAKRGQSVYTPTLFYKFYRFAAKLAPAKLMMKASKT